MCMCVYHNFTMGGVGNQELPDLSSSSLCQHQWFLSPGTLVLLAPGNWLDGPSSNQIQYKQGSKHRKMQIKLTQQTKHIFIVITYKIPGWPSVGTHQRTLGEINLAL